MRRMLEVSIEDKPVGTLYENQGIWSFSYQPEWLDGGFELSPHLPLKPELFVDSGTLRPVQWYFDNLLPEDDARKKLIRAQRTFEFAQDTPRAWDSWRLLETFGSESAGALTLLPPGESLAVPELKALSPATLEGRIQRMESVPLNLDSPKKMAVAGAQQKLLVVIGADGALFEPVGSQPSSHLLKPDARSDSYPASAVNEWFCARVAQRLGLNVPPVELRHVPSSVYVIKRFDREWDQGLLRRRHIIDAAQLLSIDATYKYGRSGADALRDVIQKVRVKATARRDIFRWVVFNVLIGNSDAHLKNLSLYASREGYALAPHYDLLSTVSWSLPEHSGQTAPAWPDLDLSFPIGDARTFAALRPHHFMQLAETIGFKRKLAEIELAQLAAKVIPAADAVMEEYLAREDIPATLRPGQARMLNAIRSMPVREMAHLLSQPPI